jgi:hypothetical protein
MNALVQASEIYNLISRVSEQIGTRKQARHLRNVALETVSSGDGFTKLAFDTRRIDQETEYNPRRGLQNYSRSEAFISEGLAQRVKNFSKLRNVLNELKQTYGKEHEWQDSNARVLLTSIDNGLRTGINDEDFATNQPGVGSFDYLDELLNVRYRLSHDDLNRLGAADLKKAILSKDEELIHKDVKQALEITKTDVARQGYDALMEKLFSVSAPTDGQPVVERSITITIRDSFPDKLNKQGA